MRHLTPTVLLTAAALVACSDSPTQVTPEDEPHPVDDSPMIVTGDASLAMLLSDITGTSTTEADVQAMGARAHYIIVEHGLTRNRQQLAGLEGEAASMMRQTIARQERALEFLMAGVPTPPVSAVAADGDNACEGDPDLVQFDTSQEIHRWMLSPVVHVYSMSLQRTDRDMKHFTDNSITIYNSQTGDELATTGAYKATHRCTTVPPMVSSSISVEKRHPEFLLLCAESYGEHRASNNDSEEDEASSRNARGCEHLAPNDAGVDPGDGHIPR